MVSVFTFLIGKLLPYKVLAIFRILPYNVKNQ